MKFRPRNFADSKIAGQARTAVRRHRKWLRRSAIVFLLFASIAGFTALDRMWIRAEGLVVGDSTAVSAIAQLRIIRLHAKCLEFVSEGAPLVELENEVTWQTANQELSRLRLLLAQSKAQIDISGKEAQAAYQLYEAQLAFRNRLAITLRAQEELARNDHVSQLNLEKARADLARADSETQAARLTHEGKNANQARASVDAELLQTRIAEFQNSPEMMGRFTLRAPKSGVLTNCQARPGEVVEARQPLYQIFNPSDAYVLVYFRPADAARVAAGKTVTITAQNTSESFSGRVTGAYPEQSGLPASFSRFFWQEERWSQYTPVRIDFTSLSAAQRSQISAGTRINVSIWEVPEIDARPLSVVRSFFGGSTTAHAASPVVSKQ